MSFERPLPIQPIDEALSPLRRALAAGSTGPWLADIVRPRLAAIPVEHIPGAVAELLEALKGQLDGLQEPERRAGLWSDLCRLDALLGLPSDVVLRPAGRKLDPGAGTSFPAGGPAEPETSPSGTLDLGTEARLDALGLPAGWVEAFGAAGAETVGDLLWVPPVSAEPLGVVHAAGRLPAEGTAAVGGKVVARGTVLRPGGRRAMRVLLQGAGPTRADVAAEGAAEIDLLRSMLPVGGRAVLAGVCERDRLRDAWVVGDEPKATARRVRWGLPGVPDPAMRGALQRAAGRLGAVVDPIPAEIVAGMDVVSAQECWAGAARGETTTRDRLAAEELLLAQLGLSWARFAPGRERGIAHAVASALPARVFEDLGLDVPLDVAVVIEQIRRDLRRPGPMRRVLVGPAGSGKRRAALWSLLSVLEGKAQVAVLCSDPGVAEEMFAAIEPALREADVACRLVAGPPTQPLRDALKRGEPTVLFGPPDIVDGGVEWRRLGLVVSFETRAGGESFRKLGAAKGPRPDLLIVADAPPTVPDVLGVLGDHDISLLAESVTAPRVRVYSDAGRSVAVGEVAEVLAARRRAVLVLPQAEGRDVFSRRDAADVVAALQAELFPGRSLGLYHGAMSRDERATARRDLSLGRYDVLVATSLIEEGGPIDGVGAVMIEQADRVDPVRIERLRGWLRGGVEARLICVVGDPADLPGLEGCASGTTVSARVPSPVHTPEGPVPTLRWSVDASLERVARIRALATRWLGEDPGLRKTPDLARALRARWADLWPTDDDEEGSFPCPVTEVGLSAGGKRRRKRRRRG